MAIEKRIELEEDAISADIPTSDEITAMEDGGAEVTLTDQTEIDEADAMGLLQDESMVQKMVLIFWDYNMMIRLVHFQVHQELHIQY
jgi:hypothetical protein